VTEHRDAATRPCLLELTVCDLALIERVRIDLAPGLNVLTGETGAGKSLVIDALSLVLGGRADAALVRAGAASARVEALFDRLPEPLICVREVTAAGRSTARVDDATVTVARLAETAGPLVEIHGQHEQQRLLDAGSQLELLDAYGGLDGARAEVGERVAAWRTNRAALEALASAPGEIERRLELLEHEVDEIGGAALRVGEAAEIRASLAAASNTEQIGRLAEDLREHLSADDRGARDVLARAAREGEELARLDGRFAPLASRIAGLAAEVDDVAADVRRVGEQVERDPAALAALEARLGAIYSLERKYGPDEAEVLAHGDRARAEAVRLRGLADERAARAADDPILEQLARAAAVQLGAGRREAAERLAPAVDAALADLGMISARFSVRVAPAALDARGADAVSFVLAPNPGEPALPLAKIASGGELSRVALGVKRVLAAADATPTLVFDEIDAGIGGRSADAVGRSLRRLAGEHQVLCVTHLAQIAAYADAHFQIGKRELDGRTITEVSRLEGRARVREIAAMLGGNAEGAGTMAAAEEMLARAALPDAPGR
jgi:DNA repair protein RecN (Recombination protein N)